MFPDVLQVFVRGLPGSRRRPWTIAEGESSIADDGGDEWCVSFFRGFFLLAKVALFFLMEHVTDVLGGVIDEL